MKNPVVFDFDKTLTDKDTLIGFYQESVSSFKYQIKYPLLLFSALLFKSGVISNDTLKKIGIWLFLKGHNKREVQKIALRYISKIKMNNIYYSDFLRYSPDRVIIISASFEEYLKPLFPDYNVVGSRLQYRGDVVVGLSLNMYGARKSNWLKDKGIDKVDTFFTDSYSDQPVMEYSDKVYLVVDGEKRKLNKS